MLQTLDTLIAFVVILTVVSLLVSLLVQMVSAALSLRGKNLANALAVTFQTIDPTLDKDAHTLAEHILQDPILSDSLFRPKNRGDATAATRQTEWGVWDLRGAWHLATAVRPGEVYRILHDLAGDPGAGGAPANTPSRSQTSVTAQTEQATPKLATAAGQLLRALGGSDPTAQEAQAKVAATVALFDQFTSPGERQALVGSMTNLGLTLDRSVTTAYDRFQRWFGSAQDRSEQWFQVHARVITIVFSFLLAFLFQLDTVEILHRLNLDQKKLVPEIVKLGPTIQRQGETILKVTPGTPAEPKTASREDVEKLQQTFQDLTGALALAGFDIVPDPFLGRWDAEAKALALEEAKDQAGKDAILKNPHWKPEDDALRGRVFRHHFLGTLVTAGLLTLGAPFWFNLLKNLMNLRPAVATLIERRPQSGPALPQTPANPVPPTS